MFVEARLERTGKKIAVNVAHIENIYSERGQAVIVMLPVGERQGRIFETSTAFDEIVGSLNS